MSNRRVLIVVEGGVVQNVLSNDPDFTYDILDWDDLQESEDQIKASEILEYYSDLLDHGSINDLKDIAGEEKLVD